MYCVSGFERTLTGIKEVKKEYKVFSNAQREFYRFALLLLGDKGYCKKFNDFYIYGEDHEGPLYELKLEEK